MKKMILCLTILLCTGFEIRAVELAGVEVEDSVVTDKGVELKLNGAGIRSKFIFDIYIAELYLEKPGVAVEEVLSAPGHKRMVMHFLYDEVEKKKLVDAWNEGFRSNSTAEKFAALSQKISIFNSYFGDIKKGEQIVLDYLPERGTRVIFAGEEKGIIEGKDFNDALLLIWLGEKPVNKSLKKKLLGK